MKTHVNMYDCSTWCQSPAWERDPQTNELLSDVRGSSGPEDPESGDCAGCLEAIARYAAKSIMLLAPDQLADVVQALKEPIKHMTTEERLLLRDELFGDYCADCMTHHLPCHCENDE